MSNLNFLDIVTILSFLVGVQNLELNEQQINNLEEHLKSQDAVLKNEQNEMLRKIIAQNKKIINLLKGIKNA